jgi:uncharacterized membrane protein
MVYIKISLFIGISACYLLIGYLSLLKEERKERSKKDS